MNIYKISLLVLALMIVVFSGCQSENKDKDRLHVSSTPHVVDIKAVDYAFQAPDSIPSGWTTFRMENMGEEHHLMLLYRLPAGKTFSDYLKLAEPFERVMEMIEENKIDSGSAVDSLRQFLPAWYAEIIAMGGPGLAAAGITAQTTVELDPGNYVMECYVKTWEGKFHATLGMVRPIKVTNKKSSASAPKADIELHLTDEKFLTDSELDAGTKTIAVHFEGAPPDVHLAGITDSTDLSRLRNWMNLLNKDDFREPVPALFLGGAGGMPVGHTAYFTVKLDSGQYA